MSYNYGGYQQSSTSPVSPNPYARASAPVQPAVASSHNHTGNAVQNGNFVKDCKNHLADLKIKRKQLDTAIESLKSTGERGQKDSQINHILADDAKETAKRMDKILDLLKEEIESFEKRLGQHVVAPTPPPQPSQPPTQPQTLATKPGFVSPPPYSPYPTTSPPQQSTSFSVTIQSSPKPPASTLPPPQQQRAFPAATTGSPYGAKPANATPAPAPAPTFNGSFQPQPPKPTASPAPSPAPTWNTGAFNGQQQASYQAKPASATPKPAPKPIKHKKNGKSSSSSSSSSSDGLERVLNKFASDLNAALKPKKDKKDKKDKK